MGHLPINYRVACRNLWEREKLEKLCVFPLENLVLATGNSKSNSLVLVFSVIAFMMTYSTPSHDVGRTASAAGHP